MSWFTKIKEIWSEWGFEIVLGLCIVFILIYALYRKLTSKKGTWSTKVPIFPDSMRMKSRYSFGTSSRGKGKGRDSKGEVECRRVLEEVFQRPFDKARPDFLRNTVTENYNLELDCWNPELKLAVEYNGIQHYKFVPYFHKNNKEAFLNQKYRDDMKRRICKDEGICLIEVPYTVKIEDIKEYIVNECRKKGFRV